MPRRDIIVMGGSAGGIEALKSIVAGLPPNLAAAVFVAIHISGRSPSFLAEILSRAGALPARVAMEGEPIESGRIYVARPGLHLLVSPGRVRLSRGPRENGCRPAIDPLFRSAAASYTSRVIAVLVSGMLDDGTAGLRAVKEAGGLTIVQDPREASFVDMPLNAIRAVQVDYCLQLEEIPPLLVERSRNEVAWPRPVPVEAALEAAVAEGKSVPGEEEKVKENPSPLTCPDCGGTLMLIEDGELIRFRCHVGHAYSAESLETEQAVNLERSLWHAVRTLEEQAILYRQFAMRAQGQGLGRFGARMERKAQDVEQDAEAVRQVLLHGGWERDASTGEPEKT